jgi:putative ABC transport system permease protein
MRDFIQDLRYTSRLLLKAPGFTLTAVLVLGLGIGVNTAIFSLINAVLLRPLPFPNPDRLVEVCMPYQHDQLRWIDYPDFVDMAAAQHTFDHLAVSMPDYLFFGGSGVAEKIGAHFVSRSLFKFTQNHAIIGRLFTENEDIPHGPFVVLLSEQFWRSHFQSDPSILGKTIQLSEQSFEVIGVVPVQIDEWVQHADVYLPVHTTSILDYALGSRYIHDVDCYGRIKEGVNIDAAQADLETIHNGLVKQYPEEDTGYGLRLVPLSKRVAIDYAGMIWLLGVAAGCLLLISSANVANLLYSRGLERRREMTVRSALGASRKRLVGQLLLESAVLSLMGGIIGLIAAFGMIAVIKALSPSDLYRVQEANLDAESLAFVFAVTICISLIAGLFPAWRTTKTDLALALKSEGGTSGTAGPERQRVQSILVVGQMALACALIVCAGLLARSFEAAQNVHLGFNPHGILTVEVDLNLQKYAFDPTRTNMFWDSALTNLRALPGVIEAAMDDQPPLKNGYEVMIPFTVSEQSDSMPEQLPVMARQMVCPNYFRSLQIPVLSGRDFDARDQMNTGKVVIIDSAFAARIFPNQDPIGKRIALRGEDGATIIGVVPHVRCMSPGDKETAFQSYFPCAQWGYNSEILIVRSNGDPLSLVSEAKRAINSVDPNVAIGKVRSYDDLIDQRLLTRKMSLLLVTLFSCSALFLSVIGLYGLLTYSVGQRTREIGIRMAVGAQSSHILRLVAGQAMGMVAVGSAIGIIVAVSLARFIASFLYGIGSDDPLSITMAVLVLMLTASLACLIPCRRATRINPIAALRQ